MKSKKELIENACKTKLKVDGFDIDASINLLPQQIIGIGGTFEYGILHNREFSFTATFKGDHLVDLKTKYLGSDSIDSIIECGKKGHDKKWDMYSCNTPANASYYIEDPEIKALKDIAAALRMIASEMKDSHNEK